MIMMGDKKKMITEILGPTDMGPKEEDGHSQELHAIAGELIQAVHMKDEMAAADCLKAAFECLKGYQE